MKDRTLKNGTDLSTGYHCDVTLTATSAFTVRDLHPRDCTHAGRTKKGLNPTENSILLTINIQLFNDYRGFERSVFAGGAKVYGVLSRLHHEVMFTVVPDTHRMVRGDGSIVMVTSRDCSARETPSGTRLGA